MSGESGAMGAGASPPAAFDRPERREPLREIVATGGGRGERLDPEQPADRIDDRGDVDIEEGVDATDNRARHFYDGHLPSLPVQLGSRGGTHVPERRP